MRGWGGGPATGFPHRLPLPLDLWPVSTAHSLPPARPLSAEAHPAMLVVETLLANDREERPRREPSRDWRKLSEG